EEAASPAAEVLGRAGELLQAVINLILDAERALEGRKGAIIIQLDEDAGQAVLRVSDDGPDASAPDGGATVERLVPALIARAHDGELAIGRSPEGNTRTLRLPLSARGGP